MWKSENADDRYKGRGHWFSPPVVLVQDGVPTVSTTSPDTWAQLPSSLAESKSESSGWSLPFDNLADVYDLPARRASPLADYYRAHVRSTLERLVAEGRQFGALIIEPTCLGAGGMVFVDPLFQACLVDVVRASADLFAKSGEGKDAYEGALEGLAGRKAEEWQGLPVIYDEGEFNFLPNLLLYPIYSPYLVYTHLIWLFAQQR